jgi:hypothetical protein
MIDDARNHEREHVLSVLLSCRSCLLYKIFSAAQHWMHLCQIYFVGNNKTYKMLHALPHGALKWKNVCLLMAFFRLTVCLNTSQWQSLRNFSLFVTFSVKHITRIDKIKHFWSNNFQILRMCVSIPALDIRHVNSKFSATYYVFICLPYFSKLSHKQHNFPKIVKYVLVFSTILDWNISRTGKTLGKYYYTFRVCKSVYHYIFK